nr:reverse transcriptase domain-containing protein [Tanacetum cinerariifolium]
MVKEEVDKWLKSEIVKKIENKEAFEKERARLSLKIVQSYREHLNTHIAESRVPLSLATCCNRRPVERHVKDKDSEVKYFVDFARLRCLNEHLPDHDSDDLLIACSANSRPVKFNVDGCRGMMDDIEEHDHNFLQQAKDELVLFLIFRHELTDTSPFLNVNNQRYEDLEQEFPLATLLEVNPQNYQYTTAFLKILTMREPAELIPSPPTSAVRNTVVKGNEQNLKNPNRPASDAALWEYCDKYYHQLLPIIAEKVPQEKMQQEKLKEVKARLNVEGCSGRNSKVQEVSQHFESRTPNVKGEHQRGRRSGRSRSMSESPERTNIFYRIRRENVTMKERVHGGQKRSPKVKIEEEDTGNQDRKKPKSSIKEDNISQLWVCKETDPFTPRIRYFDFPKKIRMPSKVKTYDGSEDLEDHLKIFQAAAKVERWAMPTWCHMFNSTLTGSSRQKKCIKDPVDIHHIKQREGESTEDFVQRFKTESRHVKGAPKCMRISGFMDGITNPKLIKRLHDNISKSVDEMMRTTTAFLGGEVAASNKARKRTPLTWKQQEVGEVGHRTDECMHLKRQIEELIKVGKLSHVIKELKQGNEKDQPKASKKEEASGKDKAMAILMAPTGSKKLNSSSHRTPHWFQQRNHMANGTNIATDKNRGCGTFNLYMDELCGSKIAISIQRDHRKTKSKENSSSPFNGSRNVKISSSRRNTYTAKQQDYPT